MKKTMLAVMATVGLAFGAKAEVLNSTGFEYATFGVDRNDLGEQAVPYVWSAATTDGSEATSLVCTVTDYADDASKPTNLPDAFAGAGDKYLAVDTSGDVLYRNVNNRTTDDTTVFGAAQLIGEGLFFDSDVQFTATDSTSTPTPAAGDKLIVWLSGDEDGATNLIVTAATGYNAYGACQGIANYTNNNPAILVGDNEWHRLTVAAANANDMTTFKVYVDGELVTAEGVTDGNFKSLVGSGDNRNYNTLTAAGFMGTGALDNLVWTTDDPFPPEATYTLALTFEDEDAAIKSVTVNGTEYEIEDASLGLNVTFPTDTETLTISVDLFDGYAIDGWESAEKVITVAEAVQKDVIALKLTVVADGSGEVPTSGEAEPDKSAKVKAASEEAAKAAVTVKVDASVAAVVATLEPADQATYFGTFFNKEAVDNKDGTFTVTVTVDEDAVEDALDVVIEEALETASEGEITTIPAGLCYKIESGSTVSLGTENKGVSDGKPIEVEGLSEAAGFYKVTLDVKPIE